MGNRIAMWCMLFVAMVFFGIGVLAVAAGVGPSSLILFALTAVAIWLAFGWFRPRSRALGPDHR